MQKDKKTSLVKLYQSYGFLFPSNLEEVLAFENSNDINNENPFDWDNPINLIKRGKIPKVKFNKLNIGENSISNLSMAARGGKCISAEIRKKMDDDREHSKKKQ